MIMEDERGQPTSLDCKVCSKSHGNMVHLAREMMFGLRTEFHYAECAACESVWLIDPPADLSRYYPQGYYSIDKPKQTNRFTEPFVAWLRQQRDRSYLGEGNWVGRVLARRYDNNPALRATLKLKMDRNSRILDVGCGSGKLLLRLHDLGFKSLTGIDPLIPKDIHYGNGVWVRKDFLEDVKNEGWDVIMFHHSLEHVPNPLAALQAMSRLLTTGGQCLVRLPVLSWAWEHYGTSWVQLDPPRHFWLPTDQGMRILAQSAGLEIAKVEYDSDALQFWGSELYSRDHAQIEVGLCEPKLERFFTRKQLAEFQQNAKTLNDKGLGDSAAFFMQKTYMGCVANQSSQTVDALGLGQTL
jgi:SAM-dependent methyltransferase